MKLKPITAIAVLLLVVASLLVAGCTTSTTTNSNQTPTASTTPSTATNQTFLEKYLAAYKDTQYSNNSRQIRAWDLEFINNTSARLQNTFLAKSENDPVAHDITFTVFPTTQDATNILNATNKTAYSLASTEYTFSPSGLAYQKVTGHAPQIFNFYLWNVGDSEAKQIIQIDNIVAVNTQKILS